MCESYCACRAVGSEWCKQTTDRAYAPREDTDLSVDMAVDRSLAPACDRQLTGGLPRHSIYPHHLFYQKMLYFCLNLIEKKSLFLFSVTRLNLDSFFPLLVERLRSTSVHKDTGEGEGYRLG
jgi:hypothetical protein